MSQTPEPSPGSEEERNAVIAANSRIGLILFALYLLLYIGFVLLNTFAPATMKADIVAGVCLSVLYGIGLIVAALVLALIYAMLCRSPHSPTDEEQSQ